MGIYILPQRLIKMDEDFEILNQQSVFKGSAGDYVADINGYKMGIPKEALENMYELMAKGYQEMAEINKEIANEMFHIENEVDVTYKL
jgi:hypothetical protein